MIIRDIGVGARITGKRIWSQGSSAQHGEILLRSISMNANILNLLEQKQHRFTTVQPNGIQKRGLSTSTIQQEQFTTQGSDWMTSFFTPVLPYIEQLPTWIGLSTENPNAFAISIVLTTIALRSTITLPVTIWQRARTRRMTEIVAPKWEEMKRDLPIQIGRRCRVQRKSHSEYKVELNKRMKEELRGLLRKNKCTPLPTLLIPLMVNIPLFIYLSLAIRTALTVKGGLIGAEIVPWWSPPQDLMNKFQEGAKILQARGIEGEALQKLTQIQGPTLSERDKTMFAPIGLGMLTLINVELGQWLRKSLIESSTNINAVQTKEDEEDDPRKRRIKEARQKSSSQAEFRSVVLGNVLRAASIAFVVVSSQAPSGLVIYWLSSATYTLVQNTIFAILDRNKAKERVKIE